MRSNRATATELDSAFPDNKIRPSNTRRNVGPRERYGRIGIGILSGIGAVFLPAEAIVRVALGIIGIVGLGTGVSRYCPVNRLLGIDNYGGAEEGKRDSQPKVEDARNADRGALRRMY
jgi:hypothetical protein